MGVDRPPARLGGRRAEIFKKISQANLPEPLEQQAHALLSGLCAVETEADLIKCLEVPSSADDDELAKLWELMKGCHDLLVCVCLFAVNE